MLNQPNPQHNIQIVYFSHGSSPLPILGDASHAAMVEFMQQFPSRLRKTDIFTGKRKNMMRTPITIRENEWIRGQAVTALFLNENFNMRNEQ